MMAEKMEIPVFKSETDEAKWWTSQEDRIAQDFADAAAKGQVTRGTAARRAALPTTTIRLDPNDIELARAQAERKGLRYQTAVPGKGRLIVAWCFTRVILNKDRASDRNDESRK
jgi:predicted DNA binding CopG/RHH family protein